MTATSPRRPTLRDVAQRAGVSTMTASRVLNGGENVRPALRRKVEAAVAALDYRRNENARSIRPGQRSGLVGMIITNISNPYYARVMSGVEGVIGRSGRRILVGISHSDLELEKELVRDMIGRQIEGLIVVPSDNESVHLAADRLGIPVAIASRPLTGVEADTVMVDDVGGALTGVHRVLEAGFQRVAFVGAGASVSTSARRLEGYRLAHERAGIPISDELVRRDAIDSASAETIVRQLLALPTPPDAYFTATNRIAVGALRALVPSAGDNPPPLVSFDDFDLAELISYPLVIVDHDAPALGRAAAQMLLRRLDDAEAGPYIKVTLPATIRRTSLPGLTGDGTTP
ncbi:MAG: LacI family DNA-binding transcriptional regulator [Propionicimonas sp.]